MRDWPRESLSGEFPSLLTRAILGRLGRSAGHGAFDEDIHGLD